MKQQSDSSLAPFSSDVLSFTHKHKLNIKEPSFMDLYLKKKKPNPLDVYKRQIHDRFVEGFELAGRTHRWQVNRWCIKLVEFFNTF